MIFMRKTQKNDISHDETDTIIDESHFHWLKWKFSSFSFDDFDF